MENYASKANPDPFNLPPEQRHLNVQHLVAGMDMDRITWWIVALV